MAENNSVEHSDIIIDAALRLAEERSWRAVSLDDIAEAAGLAPEALRGAFTSKTAILSAAMARVDRDLMDEGAGTDSEESTRERLFDLLMARFDLLRPYRKALANILFDQARDPLAALCLLPGWQRSLGAMLERAGEEPKGCRGRIKVKGLGLIYLATLRVFLRDESEDLSKTMAELDRNLGKADRAIRRLRGFSRPASTPKDDASVASQ